MCVPALATQPVPTMRTRGFTNLIMSWIVSPASTWPPSECRKSVIGSSPAAASASSWAVTSCASFEVISPWIRIVRDSNSRSAILAGTMAGKGSGSCFSSSPSFSSFALTLTSLGSRTLADPGS